jgi:murein hydrolase activator
VVKRELAEAKRRADAEAAARRKADAEAAAEARRNATANNPSSSAPKNETGAVTSRPAAKKVYTDLNAADVALSNNFAGNKGRLPWPVDNGVVSIPFGPYTIPGTNLKDNNPCITISTPSVGSAVKSVFDGEVSGVTNTGGVWTVMIRHGKYFCVYTNLGSTSVGKGDNVRTGQVIGKVAASDDDGGGELEFYIYNETTNVNPQPWLRR